MRSKSSTSTTVWLLSQLVIWWLSIFTSCDFYLEELFGLGPIFPTPYNLKLNLDFSENNHRKNPERLHSKNFVAAYTLKLTKASTSTTGGDRDGTKNPGVQHADGRTEPLERRATPSQDLEDQVPDFQGQHFFQQDDGKVSRRSYDLPEVDVDMEPRRGPPEVVGFLGGREEDVDHLVAAPAAGKDSTATASSLLKQEASGVVAGTRRTRTTSDTRKKDTLLLEKQSASTGCGDKDHEEVDQDEEPVGEHQLWNDKDRDPNKAEELMQNQNVDEDKAPAALLEAGGGTTARRSEVVESEVKTTKTTTFTYAYECEPDTHDWNGVSGTQKDKLGEEPGCWAGGCYHVRNEWKEWTNVPPNGEWLPDRTVCNTDPSTSKTYTSAAGFQRQERTCWFKHCKEDVRAKHCFNDHTCHKDGDEKVIKQRRTWTCKIPDCVNINADGVPEAEEKPSDMTSAAPEEQSDLDDMLNTENPSESTTPNPSEAPEDGAGSGAGAAVVSSTDAGAGATAAADAADPAANASNAGFTSEAIAGMIGGAVLVVVLCGVVGAYCRSGHHDELYYDDGGGYYEGDGGGDMMGYGGPPGYGGFDDGGYGSYRPSAMRPSKGMGGKMSKGKGKYSKGASGYGGYGY
ncbi:unnamed protein product [Amoebophrya sp. A120]|nr:unnamed protein product [Amoebophrya sp. A120]|eukprot:GSA120T00024102001.1